MQACIQAPESRCETSMHFVRRPSPSISMPQGTGQWWRCEAQLVQSRVQACKARWSGTWLSMGRRCSHVDVDPPVEGSQCPAEDPQPQCAAAAMMHGVSRPAASSWQGGCPTIAEHQEWMPPVPQQHVIFPNPGYKIEANLWNLDVQVSARRPGPLASFLRHCNTMDSPYIPSYGRGGSQPADDITNLDRHASMENLKELQKYSEKLQFEATCCRLWANGIQDQIMDEQEKVQTWISGMTDELIRLKRIQPAWIHQLQTQGGPPAPPTSMAASSIQQHQPASSSAASTITVKPAPMSRNPSMASAPKNAPISTRNGCWSMGWSNEEEAAPVIGIDDAKAAARSEWKRCNSSSWMTSRL